MAVRVKSGVDEVRYTANLHGKPTIIVQGRSDTLVPINHASRAYFGANNVIEGAASKLIFYEVTNAQHFDAFLGIGGFDTRYVPLHYYNIQALNLMWDHLTNQTDLPPSQVVRTTPRGGTVGAAPAITVEANLPAIKAAPGEDAITFGGNTVIVP
jgi:hydroxybutyrate-dimer hydrolase